jgi:hypothetical protein
MAAKNWAPNESSMCSCRSQWTGHIPTRLRWRLRPAISCMCRSATAKKPAWCGRAEGQAPAKTRLKSGHRKGGSAAAAARTREADRLDCGLYAKPRAAWCCAWRCGEVPNWAPRARRVGVRVTGMQARAHDGSARARVVASRKWFAALEIGGCRGSGRLAKRDRRPDRSGRAGNRSAAAGADRACRRMRISQRRN